MVKEWWCHLFWPVTLTFLKRFICLVEVHNNTVNYTHTIKIIILVKFSSSTRCYYWFVITQYCSRWITARCDENLTSMIILISKFAWSSLFLWKFRFIHFCFIFIHLVWWWSYFINLWLIWHTCELFRDTLLAKDKMVSTFCGMNWADHVI